MKYKVFTNDKWLDDNDIAKMIKDKTSNNFIIIDVFDNKYIASEDNICKETKIKTANDTYAYTNDILNILTEEASLQFILKEYNGIINIDNVDIYVENCLVLIDFNGKPWFISNTLLSNPECISIIGNALENNINI